MAKRPTWVLVAHRAGARIFVHGGPGRDLVLERAIDHPEGRKLSSEIDSDRAGRLQDVQRPGTRAAGQTVSAHEHVAQVFAKRLAEVLRSGRNENAFDRLVLVAEPDFLGLVRHSLDDKTARSVVGTVRKDLAMVRDADVASHLDDVLA